MAEQAQMANGSCARGDGGLGGGHSGRAGKPSQPKSQAARDAALLNAYLPPLEQLENELLERRRQAERVMLGQTKELLDHVKETQARLRNAPFAHRIPWWKRDDPR